MTTTYTTTEQTLSASAAVATVCAADYGVSATWQEYFRYIPGYDPIATAGDCEWREHVAQGAVEWIEENLVYIEGDKAGEPFILEPWQRAIVGCLFGWFRADGTRRYRRAFIYVPRKNGKTPLTAAMLLLVAYCDEEGGAQIYSAAADHHQAALIYRWAAGMIQRNPSLVDGSRCYRTTKSIEFPNGGVYRALSSDADTKHGLNAHFIVKDELHAHKNRDLSDVLKTATGSRRQPIIVTITTADYDRVSICNEEYDEACRVRDGASTSHDLLPIIFEAHRDDDITNEATWRKANPNYGVSVKAEYLKDEAARAMEIPSYRNTFKRLHLNIRTQTESVGIDLAKWDLCGEIKFTPEQLAGRKCWLGLDLASTRDTTAAVLCFPPDDPDGVHYLLARIWIPKATAIERGKNDGVDYLAWKEAGLIRFTEGYYRDATDYASIRDDIADWFATYNVRCVVADPYNAEQLMHELAETYGCEIVKQQQTMLSIHQPTVEFEKLYCNKQLAHGGNEVLRWMASNVTRLEKSGRTKFVKQSDRKRIDGIIAAVMATAGAIKRENGEDGEQSAYNDPTNRLVFA